MTKCHKYSMNTQKYEYFLPNTFYSKDTQFNIIGEEKQFFLLQF
jgi:hypothetical protein